MKHSFIRLLFISIFTAFQISGFAQNVGIGTTIPLQKLHVEGTAYIKDSLGIGISLPIAKLHIRGSGLNNQIRMDDTSGAVTRLNANYNASGPYPYIGTTSIHPFGIITNNAYRMFVDATGNIGIGTGTTTPANKLSVSGNADFTGNVGIVITSPLQKLHVEGTAYIKDSLGIGTSNPIAKLHISGSGLNNQIRMDDASGAVTRLNANYAIGGPYPYLGTTSNHPFGIITNNSYRMFVDASGNIGIGTGTTTPLAKLHIAGNVKIDGENTLEFGAGVGGKEPSAGKIGYETFTTGALDIVGAGTTTANRRVKIFSEGGTEIKGSLSIDDGTQGIGKVLTSNAAGKGTWQSLSPTAFMVYGNTGQIIPTDQSDMQILFASENWDDDNSVDAGSNFNVPATGLYHFDIKVLLQVSYLGAVWYPFIKVKINGAVTDIQYASTKNLLNSLYYSGTLKFTVGDVVKIYLGGFEVDVPAPKINNVGNAATSWNCFRVK